MATTNRGNWIVGVDLCEGNPYDGHTLTESLATIERMTGVKVTDAYVDKGYRGIAKSIADMLRSQGH